VWNKFFVERTGLLLLKVRLCPPSPLIHGTSFGPLCTIEYKGYMISEFGLTAKQYRHDNWPRNRRSCHLLYVTVFRNAVCQAEHYISSNFAMGEYFKIILYTCTTRGLLGTNVHLTQTNVSYLESLHHTYHVSLTCSNFAFSAWTYWRCLAPWCGGHAPHSHT
jgi:hypothetical protein